MAWARGCLPVLIVALAIAGCSAPPASERPPQPDRDATGHGFGDTGALVFDAAALASGQREHGRAFASFLDVDGLEAGLYVLDEATTDGQAAHGRDEVYVVLAGRARLAIGDADEAVAPGSVVFVPAGVEHRFSDVVGDLEVVVIFVATEGASPAPEHAAFSVGLSEASQTANSFDLLLHRSSLEMGVYRLPAAAGGDEPQTHQRDEINVVLAGTASFAAGEAEPLQIRPGSVVYVPSGVPHAFVTPSGDVTDVIVFPATS